MENLEIKVFPGWFRLLTGVLSFLNIWLTNIWNLIYLFIVYFMSWDIWRKNEDSWRRDQIIQSGWLCTMKIVERNCVVKWERQRFAAIKIFFSQIIHLSGTKRKMGVIFLREKDQTWEGDPGGNLFIRFSSIGLFLPIHRDGIFLL